MKSAVVILSMVVVIAAEAPYHLPRPAAHAPSFNYPPAPAPLSPSPPPPPPPPPPPHVHPRPQPQLQPQPHFVQYPPQPVFPPQFIQNSGYHYPQPNIAPTFIQPAPQPQPYFHAHPVPAPQHLPVSPPQNPYPQQHYTQPLPIAYPQPSFSYGQPQPLHAPANVPVPRPALPSPPIQPLPAVIAPQPQLQPAQPPISYYQQQQTSQSGYSYHQPQLQALQFTSQLPLQAQPLTNVASSSLSSYQADSNQYSGASGQANSDALDATVVDRVQNIIKESEHTSARDAGYLSLVSGVSLEGARPSIEISSFVQNSPISVSQASGARSIAEGSSSQSSSATASGSAPSADYGLPTITANSQPIQADGNAAFLPQNKPATSYGAPQ